MKKATSIAIAAALMLSCAAMPTAMASRHVNDNSNTTQNLTDKRYAGTNNTPGKWDSQALNKRIAAVMSEYKDENKCPSPYGTHMSNTTMRLWKVESRDTGGTLLFSDSPEYVDRDGILYQDTVSGDARILYYHLDNTDEAKKVAVVLESETPNNVIRITRGGASTPSSDYLEVGKATQMQYFAHQLNDRIYLGTGERAVLRQDMNTTILQPGQLVYGVYDFHSAGPVKVTVLMCPADADPCTFVDEAEVLPKDQYRLRGTFKGMDRIITAPKAYDPTRDGIVYFPLADDKHDVYRVGIDATDGSQVKNVGNYGVLYKLEIPIAGKKLTQFYLSPLGGVYAGAMGVREGLLQNMLPTPMGRTYFGDQTPPEPENVAKAREEGIAFLTKCTELADLGSYNASNQTSFEYSPPGASNLPVNIIMMPAK